ncbi:hypothetical protein ACNPM8_00330 [Glutamicibacter sp. AGC46]
MTALLTRAEYLSAQTTATSAPNTAHRNYYSHFVTSQTLRAEFETALELRPLPQLWPRIGTSTPSFGCLGSLDLATVIREHCAAFA